jgi:ribosome-associated translation inhibitor RaiA
MDHAIEITLDHMNPDIAPELRDYAGRRLSFALRRFQHHLHHVRLRVTDVNGPRHGVDARCSITAQLTSGKRVFVEATTAWPFRSVSQAASRLAESIRRISSCNQPFQSEGPVRHSQRRTRRNRLA